MLKKIFYKIVDFQERRAKWWQLQNLTDRELNDIGVSRSELRRAVFKD
ncbi:MAG: hypothetical protein CL959_04075 [Euryarchaeota archaeon]|nr:hypothetical protein [Euryarchaeota archaeon]